MTTIYNAHMPNFEPYFDLLYNFEFRDFSFTEYKSQFTPTLLVENPQHGTWVNYPDFSTLLFKVA